MYVEKYMTKEVITATPSTRLTDAIDIMESNRFHRIPVVDNGRLVGIITDQIILENSPSKATSLSIYEMNYLLDKTKLERIMDKEPLTIRDNALIEEAACQLLEHNAEETVVVDDDHHVLGILTQKDIFKSLVDLSGYKTKGSRLLIPTPEDRPGVIAEIAQVLADANQNISHFVVHEFRDNLYVQVQVDSDNSKLAVDALKAADYDVSVI